MLQDIRWIHGKSVSNVMNKLRYPIFIHHDFTVKAEFLALFLFVDHSSNDETCVVNGVRVVIKKVEDER